MNSSVHPGRTSRHEPCSEHYPVHPAQLLAVMDRKTSRKIEAVSGIWLRAVRKLPVCKNLGHVRSIGKEYHQHTCPRSHWRC